MVYNYTIGKMKLMSNTNKLMKDMAPYMNGGIQILIPILLGVYFGRKFDEGTDSQIWTLVLSLLGVAIGLYSFIKTILEADKQNKKRTNDIRTNNNKTNIIRNEKNGRSKEE